VQTSSGGWPSAGQHGAEGNRAADGRRAHRTPRSGRRTVATAFIWTVALVVVAALAGTALIAGHDRQPAAYVANTSHRPMFGATIENKADLAVETAEFSRMAIVHVYYPGLPTPGAWTSGLAAANHSAVIVSFNASPSAVLSGADNAALSHFFDTAPRGHPIYYSYIHEPEKEIKLGRFTVTAYKKAWARVAALADAAHNPYLHSTLILMAYDLTRWAHRDWRSYLPGGGIISTLAWDAYPVGSALNIDPRLTPPAIFMGPEIAAAKSVGLPFGFAEFGLSTKVGRPAWLRRVGNYLLHSGALFGVLFDGSRKHPSLRLTDRASIAVWRSFVSGSVTVRPRPTPSPTLTRLPASANRIYGLQVRPAVLRPGGGRHVLVSFTLRRGADVTVCILGGGGSVLRTLARPRRSAGRAAVPYYGHSGEETYLRPGRYTVLVVASNAGGSATAETTLTISRR
jgi:hypothetical protein